MGPKSVSTRLAYIAQQAREHPQWALTTLAHHIDLEFLGEAYRRTRKDGAAGVDGQTADEYATNLEENLRSLHERFKSGSYRAPPVRRVHIPKADGTTRPLGVPTFEDKLLQRAVAMVLEAVYEQDFLPCSYGFRPGRSAHQALEALRNGVMEMHGGHVVEVDIKGFFDNLDHGHLRSFLDQRVRDGVLRRAIGKWLKAGVLEAGSLQYPEHGSPQGGVISPLLANIYLHEVLDTWFERMIRPRLRGEAFLIRYADDAVLVFSRQEEAVGVLKVLHKRFGKYGLELHPEKTRLVEFVRPPWAQHEDRASRTGTFDFLGFTHYWGRSQRGNWVVKCKTAKSRFKRALKRVAEWCRVNRHLKVKEQHRQLSQKLTGHYSYYGLTGNSVAVWRFKDQVQKTWLKWLNRRSDKPSMSWDRFHLLEKRHPLPRPRVAQRALLNAARPRPDEPNALIGHVRICGSPG